MFKVGEGFKIDWNNFLRGSFEFVDSLVGVLRESHEGSEFIGFLLGDVFKGERIADFSVFCENRKRGFILLEVDYGFVSVFDSSNCCMLGIARNKS